MEPFYKEAKLIELENVLTSWLNTPFRHGCGVKGRGADCGTFVLRVLEETKFTNKPYKIPFYASDWFRHKGDDRMLNWMITNIPHEELKAPEDGCIMLFHFGRLTSHSAIYLNGHLYHSLNRIGVKKSAYRGCPWSRRDRLKLILRPVREES